MRLQHRNKLVLTTVVASVLLFGGIYGPFSLRDERPRLGTSAVEDASFALASLRIGNFNYVTTSRSLSIDTPHDFELRRQSAKEQYPFAAILCCSDSRVVPGFIFDQRAGSIFEVRNAGNVVDEDVLAPFE
jgi:carbonic anhydrase